MKLPLILPVPLLAPAFVSIFAPKIAPKAQPADLDRIGYDTIKNAPPEAGKEARAANLAALFGGDLSAPAAPVAAAPVAAAPAPPAAAVEPAAPAEQAPAPIAEPAAPTAQQAPATEDLTDDEIKRYSRHLILEDVGVEGQKRLKASKVAVVGAGGLGSPALLYLAAAGVGTLTIVDDDTVETSNLQRQIVHDTEEVGEYKAASAASSIKRVNPLVEVKQLRERLNADNAQDLLQGHDVILDGCDNFDTKYASTTRAEHWASRAPTPRF